MVLLRVRALPGKHIVHSQARSIELRELEIRLMGFEVLFAALREVEGTIVAIPAMLLARCAN